MEACALPLSDARRHCTLSKSLLLAYGSNPRIPQGLQIAVVGAMASLGMDVGVTYPKPT